MKRYFIPLSAFLLGFSLMTGLYFGILTWAQGWEYASKQFLLNRWYVMPIWIGFGIQAALYTILRFRLFIPTTTTGHTGAMMGKWRHIRHCYGRLLPPSRYGRFADPRAECCGYVPHALSTSVHAGGSQHGNHRGHCHDYRAPSCAPATTTHSRFTAYFGD